MASNRSAYSSRRSKSTKATAVSAVIKPLSAYDDAFEQHMIDNSIYPDRLTSEPENVDQLRLECLAARASLSSTVFPDSAFQNFKKKNMTSSEGTVMRSVIPIIAGDCDFPNEGHLPFTNIKSVTGGSTVKAVPDFFDGARPENIDKTVRDELSQMIIPTKHADVPVAPNFFLEAKAPDVAGKVAIRQALHDGAIGARAMHALQNYGEENPGFDGNAYSYSSTYHSDTGTLQLFAHRVTAPMAPGGRPEYHMTQFGGYNMKHSRERFVEGASAFRNARDIAQRHRDRFIQAANARSRRPGVEAPPEAKTTVAVAEQYEESTCDESAHCEDHVEPQAVGTENSAAAKDGDEEPAPLRCLYAEHEEPSKESTSLGAEPAISFATSFTSSFSPQSQTSSKRKRASHSPASEPRPNKKRRSTRRAAGSSARDH